ncbi:MAG: hypothetical protein ACRDWS_06415 [Acidimicrobiia bacterium]
MITSHDLRRLARSSEDRVVIDHRGEPIEVGGLPVDTPAPALLVVQVTEAVKQIEDDAVIRHLDRDRLWAVDAFLLDGEVLSALPDGVDSPAGLIEAVSAAGFRWQVVQLPADL